MNHWSLLSLLFCCVACGEILLKFEALEPAVTEVELRPDGWEIWVVRIRLGWIYGDDEAFEALVAKPQVSRNLSGGRHVDTHASVGGEYKVSGCASCGHEACHGNSESKGFSFHVWVSVGVDLNGFHESVVVHPGAVEP